ncbi:hypothetical protein [Streptomyces sp. NRRL F-2664]|uniref:hypothetical protein n=1 Tax=Streptomyces sp. NRRL F-2664 TaxID=1463842 RepID=UPI0004CC7D35|nr:hypothetical protein [Streptomyces sp. NRRL F-2664]
MTTATLLTPSTDTTPVEKAAVSGITDGFDPETFLWIEFHRPGGGVRIWYAWTSGGPQLGDRMDQMALGSGLDGADWLHYADRHAVHSTRGAIKIQAHPLRPILGDIQAGERGPRQWRAALSQAITEYATEMGTRPRAFEATWLGYGPRRVQGGPR